MKVTEKQLNILYNEASERMCHICNAEQSLHYVPDNGVICVGCDASVYLIPESECKEIISSYPIHKQFIDQL